MDGVVPPWRGDYHADMNVQETFWPACASGHLDLLDAWCDQMRACLPAAQAFTRRFFGTEGAFWIACTLPGYTPVDCWHTTQFAWSHTGWLGWLVWLRWRYSKDTRWLAETGYPIVAELLKFYRANLEDGVDGCLHVPLSSSPEYQSDEPEAWCADPNVDLALIRRCCDWVGEMEAALGIDDLASSARTIRRRLAPYALSAKRELCLWPGKPLDESHRHPSHLMAIHPAMDLTIDGGTEARSIIDASVKQYLALGQWLWAGHTYAQLISFAAVLGRAGWAYDSLLQFAEHWIGPNGLHFNRDFHWTGMSAYGYTAHPEAAPPFTIEASCAVGAGISDMLVQGWGDIVRIFPAVPPHWRDVAFRGLLTEGAFRVSAIRRAGRTVSVRIVAGVDGQLRLRDPFGGQTVTGGPLRREGDLFIADMTAGQEIVLQVSGEVATFEDAAVFVRQSDPSRLGLR
jgi:alpha-L-fucosidase 2